MNFIPPSFFPAPTPCFLSFRCVVLDPQLFLTEICCSPHPGGVLYFDPLMRHFRLDVPRWFPSSRPSTSRPFRSVPIDFYRYRWPRVWHTLCPVDFFTSHPRWFLTAEHSAIPVGLFPCLSPLFLVMCGRGFRALCPLLPPSCRAFLAPRSFISVLRWRVHRPPCVVPSFFFFLCPGPTL